MSERLVFAMRSRCGGGDRVEVLRRQGGNFTVRTPHVVYINVPTYRRACTLAFAVTVPENRRAIGTL